MNGYNFIPYARFNNGCDVSISARWIDVDDCNQLSNGSSPEAPEHLIPLRSCSTAAVLCSASMQCNAYFGNCPWNKAELYLIYFQFWELIWSDGEENHNWQLSSDKLQLQLIIDIFNRRRQSRGRLQPHPAASRMWAASPSALSPPRGPTAAGTVSHPSPRRMAPTAVEVTTGGNEISRWYSKYSVSNSKTLVCKSLHWRAGALPTKLPVYASRQILYCAIFRWHL